MKVTDDSKQLTSELLGSRVSEYRRDVVNPESLPITECLYYVATQLDVPNFDPNNTTRIAEQVDVRHCVMFAIRKLFPIMPLKHIAAYLGRRDHSTVIHACKKIQTLFDKRDRGMFVTHGEQRMMEAAEGVVLLLRERLNSLP